MQLESLFSDQKWKILKEIASQPQSPLQLSLAVDERQARFLARLVLAQCRGLFDQTVLCARNVHNSGYGGWLLNSFL